MSLRADNADQRLTDKGIQVGCVGFFRRSQFEVKKSKLTKLRSSMEAVSLSPQEAERAGLSVKKDGKRRTAFELLSFPDITVDDIRPLLPPEDTVEPEIVTQIARDALYASYIERQTRDAEALQRDEAVVIPIDFDFTELTGLSNELKTKLSKARPETLAQAAKVDGVTPAALTLILGRLKVLKARVG